MHTIDVKDFDHPSDKAEFVDHMGVKEVVMLDGRPVVHSVFEPGWHWAEHAKPLVGTETCPNRHLGYCTEGHLRVMMDDGSVKEVHAGDTFYVEPGHDAEVIGDERCVIVDFGSYE
ncbi:cupin domain-containing protein [Glycomyces sp. L485]|uniref:cupin domain-containing protein n=1 Tax=Glycomyces sp. L485 TaxID=2909235 RepID=UPI001F4B54BC|nr:cupin domain-containing protein [Glycomyces sp. L485]MCH7230072.1 cupin domain-containing protein [Glycomyces sp. L485]